MGHKPQQSQKRRSGDKKHGRNLRKCEFYRLKQKHEKSHIRRIKKHIRKYGDNSPCVMEALERYEKLLG